MLGASLEAEEAEGDKCGADEGYGFVDATFRLSEPIIGLALLDETIMSRTLTDELTHM